MKLTRARRTLSLAAVGIGTLTLTGCLSPSLDIPAYTADIAPCQPRSTPYPVTDIPKHAPVPCDISGEILVFPNGYEMTAPPQGVNGQQSGFRQVGQTRDIPANDQYSFLNFGTFGMILGELNTYTCKSSWWGTAEGLERYWAAFGNKVHDDVEGECGTPMSSLEY